MKTNLGEASLTDLILIDLILTDLILLSVWLKPLILVRPYLSKNTVLKVYPRNAKVTCSFLNIYSINTVSSHVMESKTVLDSGFHVTDSRF